MRYAEERDSVMKTRTEGNGKDARERTQEREEKITKRYDGVLDAPVTGFCREISHRLNQNRQSRAGSCDCVKNPWFWFR